MYKRQVCAAARARAFDGSPTPLRTRSSVVLPPPRPPSPPGPRPRRGTGRGARGPFANQKNRRAQNDCADVLDEFVRALLPRSTSRRAGRPAGSTPLRVRTVFFEAVMFPLHCYLHIVLLLTPRVVSSSPPALIRSSQSTAVSGVGHLGATSGSPGRRRARPRRRRLETLRRGLVGRRAPPGFLRAGAVSYTHLTLPTKA